MDRHKEGDFHKLNNIHFYARTIISVQEPMIIDASMSNPNSNDDGIGINGMADWRMFLKNWWKISKVWVSDDVCCNFI